MNDAKQIRSEGKKLQRETVDERLKNLQIEMEERFSRSDDYKYIKQFAKKYGNKADSSDLAKLQALLSNRHYNFSINKLKEFVRNEIWMTLDEFIFEKVFVNNPATVNEAIRSFLQHCNPDDVDLLISFMRLLERNGFNEINPVSDKNILLETLIAKIRKVEKEIELENFENRLDKENEQIWLEDIDRFNGYEFEDFLKNLFSKMSYRVEQTRLSGDQGADLVVNKFGEKTAVQAKRFGGKVGNKAVQEILAAMSLYKAQKGMVVTNSYFTPAAIELANANKIELIDRDALEELINKHW